MFALGLDEVLLGCTKDAPVELNLSEVNDKVRWEGNKREVETLRARANRFYEKGKNNSPLHG